MESVLQVAQTPAQGPDVPPEAAHATAQTRMAVTNRMDDAGFLHRRFLGGRQQDIPGRSGGGLRQRRRFREDRRQANDGP